MDNHMRKHEEKKAVRTKAGQRYFARCALDQQNRRVSDTTHVGKNWGFQKARKGELALFFPFPETDNYMNVFVNFRRWCMLFNDKGVKS